MKICIWWTLRFTWLQLFWILIPVVMTCPSGCICKWKGGKQTVECKNLGFLSIPDGIDPGTQVLDLVGNSIQSIGREKFKVLQLVNLQRIYMSKCRLKRIDDRAFVGLTNLVELDLAENLITEIPSVALKDCSSLMRLTLTHNSISRIKKDAFRDLTYLSTLELNHCDIEEIEEGAFDGLVSLEWLKIDHNKLMKVNGFSALTESLHGIDIHDNPWMCNCRLLDMYNWLKENTVPFSIEPKCVEPERLKDQVIKNIEETDLACFPDVSPTTMYLEIAEGKNVSLLCKVTAIPEAKVSWWYQDRILHNDSIVAPGVHLYYYVEEGSTNKRSELFIMNTTREDNGTFICVAENPAGKAQSNYTIRIVVKQEDRPMEAVAIEYVLIAGGAIIVLAVLVCVIMILLCVKCHRDARMKRQKRERTAMTLQKKTDLKVTSRMPKTIQMGVGLQVPLNATKPNGSVVTVCEEVDGISANSHMGSPRSNSDQNPDLINDTTENTKEPKRHHNREDGDGEETDGSSRPGSYREAMENIINDYGETCEAYGTLPLRSPIDEIHRHCADVHLLPSRYLDAEGYPYDYGLPKVQKYPNVYYAKPFYPGAPPGQQPPYPNPQEPGFEDPRFHQGYAAGYVYPPDAIPVPENYDLLPSPPAAYKNDSYLPRSHSSGLPYEPTSPPPVVPGNGDVNSEWNETHMDSVKPEILQSEPHQLDPNSVKSKVALIALQQNPIHESPDEGYEDDQATEGTEI